jgi:chromosome segregation protein
LKLSRLRLLGFKSFVEPTEFHIEPGLTGIVGPNGCGKSNLVEALRWVMGEASHKNMRASGMDEVIFSGSGARPSRNMAEVTLVVDNSERTAPAAFNDEDTLEVSRHIEREAGSTYRVNGREVRARDVQLLFADASTGAHSPAIVGQGKIGELIAAKPQARRALLEEAAGVAGLHGRRHEAELRLKAAETNLQRLDDVIREIETQLDALRRQARQAVRYRNLSAEIRKGEAAALYLRFEAAQTTVGESGEALDAANRVTVAREDAQARAAREQAVAAAGLQPLRDRYSEAAATLQRVVVEGQTLDAEEQRVKARLDELAARIAQFSADIERERQIAVENREMLAKLDREERTLRHDEAGTAEREAAFAAERDAAEARLVESEKRAGDATAELADLNARRGQLERALREAGERRGKLGAELGSVEAELRQLSASAAMQARVSAARQAVESATAAAAEAEASAVAAEQRAAERRAADAAARGPLGEAERRLSGAEAEARTLQSTLTHELPNGMTPIVEQVRVPAGLERAMAAVFADDLDAPADADAPVHWRRVTAASDDPRLPAGAQALADFVEGPAELARRLRQVGLVDFDMGMRLRDQLLPGQILVTPAGDLWRWDGYTAGADAPTAAAERFANRNRLAALGAETDELRAAMTSARASVEAAENAARDAGESERLAREAWRTAQHRLDEARKALADVEREAGRDATRMAALIEAKARLASGVADAEAAHGNSQVALAALGDAAALEARLAEHRNTVAADRAAFADARAGFETLAREAALRQKRLTAIAEERRSWNERAAGAVKQIETLDLRRKETEAERASLAEQPQQIVSRRMSLLDAMAKAEEDRQEAADALSTAETALAEADKAAKESLVALSEAREQRGRAEERLASARERLTEITQRINEALECSPAEARALAGIKDGAPLPDLTEIEARMERYRQERERLGGVNLRADDEANELSARRDTLVKERDDLVAAIQRFRQGIASLNREGRERLLAAYETVNKHFAELFTHLFGGGTAELILTESDDPLEAGLEIMARPPGKRLQSMTLLSGGEQALTALALIFAVFRTNPAPICVLDEVDAPLDDANVERFCDLLEEMTRLTDTRFVTVTHNPITMSRMNRLFGVTMAERGVSQLVSVDLETAERFREAG